jgi:hypothetical protein
VKDERSVDEYLGFATRKLEEREQDADAGLDDDAYEGSWYQLLKQRVDTDGDHEHP